MQGKAQAIIPPMQTLRRAHFLARLVLVWFALSLGVAAASPLVQPRVMELVCSSAGMVKILVQTDDGMQEVSNHTLDCPLCLAAGAPPPFAVVQSAAIPPLAYVLRSIPSARLAALTAGPPPARGPPALRA